MSGPWNITRFYEQALIDKNNNYQVSEEFQMYFQFCKYWPKSNKRY